MKGKIKKSKSEKPPKLEKLASSCEDCTYAEQDKKSVEYKKKEVKRISTRYRDLRVESPTRLPEKSLIYKDYDMVNAIQLGEGT
jgi:hypothetical protein